MARLASILRPVNSKHTFTSELTTQRSPELMMTDGSHSTSVMASNRRAPLFDLSPLESHKEHASSKTNHYAAEKEGGRATHQ